MSAAIPITRLGRTAPELRGFAGKCGDGAQVRRLLALALVLEGRSRAEAAKRHDMDHALDGGPHDAIGRVKSDGFVEKRHLLSPCRSVSRENASTDAPVENHAVSL